MDAKCPDKIVVAITIQLVSSEDERSHVILCRLPWLERDKNIYIIMSRLLRLKSVVREGLFIIMIVLR